MKTNFTYDLRKGRYLFLIYYTKPDSKNGCHDGGKLMLSITLGYRNGLRSLFSLTFLFHFQCLKHLKKFKIEQDTFHLIYNSKSQDFLPRQVERDQK